MNDLNPIWLITNASSGSNAADALDALEACCGEHGWVLARRSRFPEDDLPDPANLDADRRNFRDGPHEVLGRVSYLRPSGATGGPFGLLIDGEQASPEIDAEFRLVPCEVDLIATGADGL